MNVFRATKDALVLRLNADERRMLVSVLRQYPVVPESFQRLSRSPATGSAEHQQLLNEALAEQRQRLKQHVQDWLAGKNRFRPVQGGVHFTLKRMDSAWLLQVLNDVRVGNWLRLGAPEELPQLDDLSAFSPEQLGQWLAMELSGRFQMELLMALENPPPP
jgi:hypothetical protein